MNRLCEKNPELEIYILAWRCSYVFIMEWEKFQEHKFNKNKHGRIHFRYDGAHAIGASHHQKFVVIDGHLAFVGGIRISTPMTGMIDSTSRTIRTEWIPATNRTGRTMMPKRMSPVLWPRISRPIFSRWKAATEEDLSLPAVSTELFTPDLSLSLPAGPVAVSRNEPFTLNDPNTIAEIRELYVDAIHSAEELIFIENQYFSSQIVFQALQDKMKAARSPLEIVIVLPKRVPSSAEAALHSPPKLRMLERLKQTAAETGGATGFYYSVAPDGKGNEIPITIHTKILIIDDRFLSVGSANTSNRSMGLDTELNLDWEATDSENKELIEAIHHAHESTDGTLRHSPIRRR